MAKKKKASSSTSMIPDWSLLPEKLLHLVSENLEDCFDIVHARSVCRYWRSIFAFPSSLLRPSYSLPAFAEFPYESKDLCTLKKIPLFLFRVKTPPTASASEYFLGGIGQDESEDLPSPLHCSVKVKIQQSDPTLINIPDCQILPLGHQYRMVGWDPEEGAGTLNSVAFLPLNKQGGGGFVVRLNRSLNLLVLTSAEMKWRQLKNVPYYWCTDLVTFRGRFYAAFLTNEIFVIDPHSLEATSLLHSRPLSSIYHLVPSGNDELFLVEKIISTSGVLYFGWVACRVSRLDEEAGKWVDISDLGNRVLFIGLLGNVCCSATELPEGCGVSGNSIVFTDEPDNITYAYKYLKSGWRFATENRVMILNTPPVVSLRVE